MKDYSELKALAEKATPGPWGMETVRTSCGVCHKIGPWPHKWRAGTTMSACIYDDYPSPPEGTNTMLANAAYIVAACNEVLSLIAENEALREALRPFAKAAKQIDADNPIAPDHDEVGLPLSDLRRARIAYEGK